MKKINNIVISLLFILLSMFFVGCGSSSRNVEIPQVKLSDKFRFDKVKFDFTESRKSDNVIYHTAEELERILNDKIRVLLEKKDLLSNDKSMNILKIQASYQRLYVGDETPIPIDSLRYPKYSYKIDILDESNKVLKSLDRNHLTYQGGFVMNMKVIAGKLRDKKYEIKFIEALANTIVAFLDK